MMDRSIHSPSPEPGFPKRRAAASRLNIPNEGIEGQHGVPRTPGGVSTRTPKDGPPSRTPRPIGSKHSQRDQAVVAVGSIAFLMLLLAVSSIFVHKHRQFMAVVGSERKHHQAELDLQAAWLAATTMEQRQLQDALKKADADYLLVKKGLQRCMGLLLEDRKPAPAPAGNQAVVKQLQAELQAAQKSLQDARQQLKNAHSESKSAQGQHQQQLALNWQIAHTAAELAKQQLEETSQSDKKAAETQQQQQQGKQTAELVAAQGALQEVQERLRQTQAELKAAQMQNQQTQKQGDKAASAVQEAKSPSAHTDVHKTVILVTCDESDTSPDDIITPWCESAVQAHLRRVMVVTTNPACQQAAAAHGLKVLVHDFKVPDIQGQYAIKNKAAYSKYAALKQVLHLGYPAASIEPDVLLLANPLQLLQQHPTDVVVMSRAGKEDLAYGHQDQPPADGAVLNWKIGGLSTSVLYLKPQEASLAFVQVMMDSLVLGNQPEVALLNQLLLTPWHLVSGQGSSSGSSSSSLTMPLRVGVLPVTQFTNSEVVYNAREPKAWLQQQKPIAVQVLSDDEHRVRHMREIISWRAEDEDEVIFEQLPDGSVAGLPSLRRLSQQQETAQQHLGHHTQQQNQLSQQQKHKQARRQLPDQNRQQHLAHHTPQQNQLPKQQGDKQARRQLPDQNQQTQQAAKQAPDQKQQERRDHQQKKQLPVSDQKQHQNHARKQLAVAGQKQQQQQDKQKGPQQQKPEQQHQKHARKQLTDHKHKGQHGVLQEQKESEKKSKK